MATIDDLKRMMMLKNDRTGRLGLARKATIDEGLPTEKRVCQRYHDVHMQATPERILADALVVEGLSSEPGEPSSLRLSNMGSEPHLSEGRHQIDETVLIVLEAAAYAEGLTIRDYCERLLRTIGQ